jgi:hypothetical protein
MKLSQKGDEESHLTLLPKKHSNGLCTPRNNNHSQQLLTYSILLSTQKRDKTLVLALQLKKTKPREVRTLAVGHRAVGPILNQTVQVPNHSW